MYGVIYHTHNAVTLINAADPSSSCFATQLGLALLDGALAAERLRRRYEDLVLYTFPVMVIDVDSNEIDISYLTRRPEDFADTGLRYYE